MRSQRTVCARTAQVSLEYMMIVGLTLAILVPLLVLYANTQNQTKSLIAEGQVLRLSNTIRDVAERVYYTGAPAQEVLLLTVPEGIVQARLDNRTIVYTLHGPNGNYDVHVTGLAPLNGTLPTRPGQHRITVVAANGTVYVLDG